jgi:hypothetical protein
MKTISLNGLCALPAALASFAGGLCFYKNDVASVVAQNRTKIQLRLRFSRLRNAPKTAENPPAAAAAAMAAIEEF